MVENGWKLKVEDWEMHLTTLQLDRFLDTELEAN